MPSSSFSSVSRSDLQAYQELWNRTPIHCADYTFTNLWGWVNQYGLEWRFEHNLCWIRQAGQEAGEERFWAPVGDWHAVDWASLPELEKGARWERVPEALSALLAERLPGRVAIEETRGQWEYLYTVQALATLSGNKLHKKKNHVNAYLKAYGEDYRPMDGKVREEALILLGDWCRWKECGKSPALQAESDATQRVLEHWEELPGLIGGALYVEERMAAFTVGEALDENILVVHFEKGRPEYRGVYQAMNYTFMNHVAQTFTYVDREQDADEEGLRQAKNSYFPVDFLRKNTVRIAPAA